MKLLAIILFTFSMFATAQTYQGQLTVNPFSTNSVTNPSSTFYDPFINQSFNAPRLYNSQGEYRGKLSDNQYDLDSISNRYGRYGSKYSLESINNPYGAGSQYKLDSPNNPYGSGWDVYSDDGYESTLPKLKSLDDW